MSFSARVSVAICSTCAFMGLASASSTAPHFSDLVLAVHFDDETCQQPISVVAFVPDEPNPFTGILDEDSTCVEQIACLQDKATAECQRLSLTKDLSIYTSITEQDNLIALCDPSNEVLGEPTCTAENGSCGKSSTTNGCYYEMALLSEIQADPALLQNNNIEDPAIDKYSYMLFYSDSQCEALAGLHGIVVGEQEVTFAGDTATCADAMACISNPTGPACEQATLSEPASVHSIHTYHNGTHMLECDDSSQASCRPLPAATCMPHPHTNCHYRWTDARTFFTEPATFLEGRGDVTVTKETKSNAALRWSTLSVVVAALLTGNLL